jgi:hypothetical protein
MTLPYKGVIKEQHFAGLKNNKDESGITGDNFGGEHVDNGYDQDAMNVNLSILEVWPGTDKPKTIRFINDGYNILPEIMMNQMIKMPVTKYKYSSKATGCRGFGAKAEWFRVGMPKLIRTPGYKMTFTPCSDENGKNPIDFESLSHYDDELFRSIAWTIEKDDYEFPFNQGVETTIHVKHDCPINFNFKSMHKFWTKRFSLIDNFDTSITNEITGKTFSNSKMVYRSLDKNNNLMSGLNCLPTYSQTIVVSSPFDENDEYEFTLNYNWRISKTHDIAKYNEWKRKSKSDYEFKIDRIAVDQPVMNVVNNNNTIIQSSGRDWWSSWDSKRHGQLEIHLKSNKSLNPLLSRVKSDGIAVDEFRKDLGDKVIALIKEDTKTFNSPYANVSQKAEDSFVDQWMKSLTSKQDGLTKRLSLNTLDTLLKPKDTINKDNWIIRRTLCGREIDLRFKESVMFEWQEGTSDVKHMDGIEARLNRNCLNTNSYKSFVWVADNHTLRDDLKMQMIGLDWNENTSFEKVYLITKEQIFDGWEDIDELSVIDLKKDVLTLKNN